MNPATDFRAASGRPKIRRGRGGVNEPHKRPIVEAAVSAHDRLLEMEPMSEAGDKEEELYAHENRYNSQVKRVYRKNKDYT